MTDGQAHKNFIVSPLLLPRRSFVFALSLSLLFSDCCCCCWCWLGVAVSRRWESVGKSENCSTGWPVGVSSGRPRQRQRDEENSLLAWHRTRNPSAKFVLNCRLAELWNVADSVNFPFVPTAHGLFVIRLSREPKLNMMIIMMISSRLFDLVKIAFCVSGIRFGVLFTAFHSFCCQY